jgi:hypothetical protein
MRSNVRQVASKKGDRLLPAARIRNVQDRARGLLLELNWHGRSSAATSPERAIEICAQESGRTVRRRSLRCTLRTSLDRASALLSATASKGPLTVVVGVSASEGIMARQFQHQPRGNCAAAIFIFCLFAVVAPAGVLAGEQGPHGNRLGGERSLRMAQSGPVEVGRIFGGSGEGPCKGEPCPGVKFFFDAGCVWVDNSYPRQVELTLDLPSGPFKVTLKEATMENVKKYQDQKKCQAAYAKLATKRSMFEVARKAGAQITPKMMKEAEGPPPGCPPESPADPDKPIEVHSLRTGIIGGNLPNYSTRLKVNGTCLPRRNDIKSYTTTFVGP